jgi:hypothetical protein
MRVDRGRSSYHPRWMRRWRRERAKARVDAAVAALAEEPVEALVVMTDDAPDDDALVVADSGMSAAPPVVDAQAELLKLFEVVTSMCDHVIGYIEADRAERQVMMDTLAQLGRVIVDGAAAAVAASAAQQVAAQPVAAPAPPLEVTNTNPPPLAEPRPNESAELRVPDPRPNPIAHAMRERVIGGSMPAGPEPVISLPDPEPVIDLPRHEPILDLPRHEPVLDLGDPDLADAEPAPEPQPDFMTIPPAPNGTPSASVEIAVEVRGRFGDRWVAGFEICEVMTTPAGPRYRLRRRRDGAVLPELFDATNLRHVETFDELAGVDLNGATANGGTSNGGTSNGAATNGATTNGSTPRPVNGSAGYWSRS